MSNFDNYVYFQEGPGLTSNLFAESGFPFINIRCIENNKLNKKNVQFISDKIANTIYKHFKIESGDILLSTSGSLGKKVKIKNQDLPLMLNTSIMRFRSKNTNDLINEYLFYYLESRHLLKQVEKEAQGSAQVNLGPTHFKKFDIYLPNLPTQKRIAKILSTVDGQIEKTDAIIAKYQAIKQGMLHDLFTRGIDLATGKLRPTPEQAPELYKSSPLGLIPKAWNYKTLKNITLVNQGLQIPISSRYKDYKDNRYLYITIQLLNNPTDESYTYYIDNPPISVVCKTQDVLMVRTGNTGAVITNIAGCFHNNFFKIAYNSEYTNRDFLVQYLNLQHIQEKIMNYAGTTTIPDLKHGDFYKLPYLEPKPEEQKYISAKINQIDMLIASENKTLEKLQKLKQGLMSRLLQGK